MLCLTLSRTRKEKTRLLFNRPDHKIVVVTNENITGERKNYYESDKWN